MEIKRHCICCEKPIESCKPEADSIQSPPNNATYWQTRGNFGSTVFDGGEFTGEMLETYICDECLKKKARFVYKYRTERINETRIKDLQIFDPEK